MGLVTVKSTRCDEYRWFVVKCFMGTQTMAGALVRQTIKANTYPEYTLVA